MGSADEIGGECDHFPASKTEKPEETLLVICISPQYPTRITGGRAFCRENIKKSSDAVEFGGEGVVNEDSKKQKSAMNGSILLR